MKLREIFEKVANKQLHLDTCGHLIDCSWNLDGWIEHAKDWIALESGSNDGKWSGCESKSLEEIEKINADMQRFYTRKLDYDTSVRFRGAGDDPNIILPFDISSRCFNCGEKLYWVLDETTNSIKLKGTLHPERRPMDWTIPFYTSYPEPHICEFATPQPFKGEITVQSPLIFANFFDFEDCLPENKYTEEWSLNYLRGRKNITEYKATQQNIAYGQFSSDFGIFYNKDKNEIIIGNPWWDDAEKTRPFFQGFEYKGRVSICVWRWEATDIKTLGDVQYKKLKEEKKYDVIELDVPHGIWEFEHYCIQGNEYDNILAPHENIYSKFKLKE